MLITGDKIRQIKAIGSFNKLGHKFTVTDISDDGIITFKIPYGTGMMSWKEYNDHFEKIEDSKWTSWTNADDYEYKTNGKQVKVQKNGIKAKASCCPEDSFDLEKGISIALARIEVKAAEAKLVFALATDDKTLVKNA